MTDKTLPEQARFMAKIVEERLYDDWPYCDFDIAQMLEDLAGEIDRLQACTRASQKKQMDIRRPMA